MSQNVRVYNDNTYTYKENFKGDLIEIPPKGFVEMEYFDAIEFKGTMNQIKKDGGGTPLPESFKMIRIVQPADFAIEEAKNPQITCQSCGEKFADDKALDEHCFTKHKNDKHDIEKVQVKAKKPYDV